ncbi:MAG: hypothetical protein J3K34DRAFT_520416 [Monoraphidium minutum]|nr:MAG: hypothetical protein J3K34DRAFT_520416 [Monoraphidium minutum]
MHLTSCRAARAAPARALAPRRGRARCVRPAAIQAGAADHTARVRGDAALVSYYCSDLAAWPAWSPITKAAVKVGVATDGVEAGAKFELKQELWGVLSYPMLYEVLEFTPGRKLVLSGVSEHHTELSQFVFMPDRTDPRMTIVRYVSEAQLRQWRSALQPVVSKLLQRVPEDSIAALQRLLNGPASPISTPEVQAAFRRHAAAAVDARKGRRPAAEGGARPRAAPRAAGGGGGWGLGGLLGGAFGGRAERGGGHQQAAAAAAHHAPTDPSGHYAALGFVASALGGAGGAPTAEEAASDFARVVRAYEALKDPEARRLYDAGLIVEHSLEL